jgi:hypothetical protein
VERAEVVTTSGPVFSFALFGVIWYSVGAAAVRVFLLI